MKKINTYVLMVVLVIALSSCAIFGIGDGSDETSYSEGSISNPITLTVGITYAGKVGGEVGDDSSYYKFIATASSHTITISNMSADLDWYLYEGAAFIYDTDIAYSVSSNIPETGTASELTIGQTYYLEIYNWDYANSNFSLLIN